MLISTELISTERRESGMTRDEQLIAAVQQSGFPHLDSLIHLFVGGSELHGAKVKDTGDLDIYGVYLEPPELVLGLDKQDFYVWSTAGNERRNGPDDVDVCLYSLRKWAGLAAKGTLRYQHASELRSDLQRLKRDAESGKIAASEAETPRRSRRTLLGLAAAVVLVVAAFLAWRFLSPQPSGAIPIHSIAVLPFANASNNSEMDYLGEGISEEITNSLSRLPDLQVVARSTVSHYKSRQDDPQGVGRDLHVDAVLAG